MCTILTASKSKAEYKRDIASCLESIASGESYEVCLTLQFSGKLPHSRRLHDGAKDDGRSRKENESTTDNVYLDMYKALRKSNPAPYACYLRYDPVACYYANKQHEEVNYEEGGDGNANAPANMKWYTKGGFAICSSSPECFLKATKVRILLGFKPSTFNSFIFSVCNT